MGPGSPAAQPSPVALRHHCGGPGNQLPVSGLVPGKHPGSLAQPTVGRCPGPTGAPVEAACKLSSHVIPWDSPGAPLGPGWVRMLFSRGGDTYCTQWGVQ